METPSYEQICSLVGRLYLESSTEIERLSRRLVEVTKEAEIAKRERFEALAAMRDAQRAGA